MELIVFLPGMLLAYFPMKGYLRLRPPKLAAAAFSLILLLGIAGEGVRRFAHINILWLFFPAAAIMGCFYVHTLKVTRWKSVSVFLAICGVFSCLGNAAIGISGETTPPFPPHTAVLWFLMCCVLTTAAWHPASHAARQLLADDAFAPTWYVFWVLPAIFISLNLFIMPRNAGILEQGRLRLIYIMVSLVFLILLLSSYLLFYLMASSLNRNNRLRLENQFLSMQQARYDSLLSTARQIRQARHDLRHHFHVLQGFAAQKNWDSLTAYLDDAQGSIPDGDLGLCENTAVDNVAGYFVPLYKENGIPLSLSLDLPHDIPVPDTDLCSVLSNLLENAMEASLRTAPEKRSVQVSARLRSGNMLLLSVENSYDGEVREKNGVFLSSKRPGEGIGLQAVQHTAEKNGGYCRFHYGKGIFTANVMLRGRA